MEREQLQIKEFYDELKELVEDRIKTIIYADYYGVFYDNRITTYDMIDLLSLHGMQVNIVDFWDFMGSWYGKKAIRTIKKTAKGYGYKLDGNRLYPIT